MAYFNELPLIEYPSRFKNKSSNQDYTSVRNLFRRAILRSDILNSITAFSFYQVKPNERAEQIAERFYGDPELDWVILITNNIVNYRSQWVLDNDAFYEYLMDKYETEDNLNEIKYYETNLVKDEFDRTIVPEKLQIQTDLYQEFRTKTGKENPLYYDLEFYPVPNKYYPLKVETNLSQYVEVWERDNLGPNEEYTGEKYEVSNTFVKKKIVPPIQSESIPPYTRFDYSILDVYSRENQPIDIIAPNDLDGWPYKWGGNFDIYTRTEGIFTVDYKPILGKAVDITDDYRLYTISSFDEVDFFTYTEGTTLPDQANEIYEFQDPDANLELKREPSKFEIQRNSKGEIIRVKVLDGGQDYFEGQEIIVKGSLIGGEDIIDDIVITVTKTKPKAQFRFFSIGDELNEPYPNMKISTFNETGISYMNSSYVKVDVFDNFNAVSNYEYENTLNENTRRLLILKPEYVNVFIGELRNIMSYDKSSETINKRLKRVENSNIF